jgi:chemotaxis protein MotB
LDDKEVALQSTPEGIVITLREPGLFRSGEAKLIPEATEKLLRIASVLKQRNLDLRVEGHSDDQPIHSELYRSNWELSTARAMSVVSTLVDGAGYPPERIAAAGYGPYRPVASNATPEGRSKNRRIDLVVIKRSGGTTKTSKEAAGEPLSSN